MRPSFKVVFCEKNTYESHEYRIGPTVLITNTDANPNLVVSKLSFSDRLESVSLNMSTFGV